MKKFCTGSRTFLSSSCIFPSSAIWRRTAKRSAVMRPIASSFERFSRDLAAQNFTRSTPMPTGSPLSGSWQKIGHRSAGTPTVRGSPVVFPAARAGAATQESAITAQHSAAAIRFDTCIPFFAVHRPLNDAGCRRVPPSVISQCCSLSSRSFPVSRLRRRRPCRSR